MIYVIGKKNYILVSGYFKEVIIKKNKNNEFEVIPKNVEKIEATTVKKYSQVPIEEAYKNIEDILEKK